MEYASIPAITILCYIAAEIYKMVVKMNEKLYKYIPLFVSILGGILGVVLYYTYPDIVIDANNPIIALVMGIISGAASTGGNQIFKQLFENKEN